MSRVEQNKAIMRRMIEEIWNKGNLMAADEIFAPNHTSPSAPDLPAGPESVKMLAGMFRAAMPDYHMTIDLIMADESKVVARFTQTGTHIGAPLMGMPPSGRHAEWTEIGVLEIENGMVVRSWYEVDMLSMMQQLNPQPATEAVSKTEQNKAVIIRLYDETNKGNYEILHELLAADFISHGGGGLPDTHGPQGLIDLVHVFMDAMPDLQFQVLNLIADSDDMVVARGLQTATHAGNFMGIAAPTGKRVEWTGTATFRFNDDGKIAERWVDMDSLSLFQQLGIVPPFGSAGG